MSPVRALFCAALVLSSAACQKAEFEKTEPEAVVISLSEGVISADDASITVSVSAVEEGVPILEEAITATIGGACVAAPQTVATDPGSGLAVFTFTGLDTAGDCTITATARDATGSVDFTVVAGAPATLALTTVDQLTIDAGETITYATLVEDAAGNDIAIGVEVNTDAPDALFDGADITFQQIGSYTIYAQLFTFTDTLDVIVEPATASSVTTTLLQTSVGQQQTLELTCGQFDAFGNPTGFNFAAADVSTNPAATTIVETTPNTFEVSGFTTFGIFEATCDDGTRTDVETFNVGQQAGANSVIATADLAQIEAGTGTLTVSCQEVDGFGNAVAFDFVAGTSFTTTAPSTPTEVGTTNTFVITNVAATGSFSATCTGSADSDGENFAVVDSTAPTVSSFTFSGTAPFAAGSTVTVNFDVVDAVGVAFESIAIVSGPGEIVGSSVNFESGLANPPSRTFFVSVNGSVGVSSTVVVRGQVADTTGNLRSTSSDLSITVDPAGTVVTATLEGTTNLEAGGSIVVACNERHALTGSSAGTVFSASTDILLGTSGHIITTLGSNRFSLSGYSVKRAETVTCDGVSDTDLATFNVVDTTPPTASTAVNPVQANYAAGTSVDVTVTSSDVVGLSNASLVVATGNATITSASVRALGGATASAPVFTVRLDGSTSSASTVTLIAQVADTTGNIREPATISLNVNQAATAVVTTLAGTAVEHNQTLDFTCKQINAATGADTGATFALGETSTTAAGGVVSSLGSNAFRITGPFTAKGSATATCTKSAQSDIETFTIYDTTAPTIGTLSVFAATGPNGVTGDNRYAPGSMLTVRLNTAADGIGLSRVDLSATGADVASSTKFVSGTAAANVDFTVHIPEDAATFGTVAITAQASDTTGNTSAVTTTLTLTVDPAVDLSVAGGVTLRTLYEGTYTAGGIPASLGTDGTDLLIQRNDTATGNISNVLRLTGSTAPAAPTTVITTGFPGEIGAGGITGGSFGSGTIFHALGTQVGTNAGTTHARFDTGTAPNEAVDVTLADLTGGATRLFTMDLNLGTGRILSSISTGATVLYSDPGETNINNCRSLTKDAANARLLIACANGDIRTMTDTGGNLGNASALLTNIGANDAVDIASTATDTVVAGGTTGEVYRVGDTVISSDFSNALGLAVKPTDSNSLHILDRNDTTEIWRVYRVTGY